VGPLFLLIILVPLSELYLLYEIGKVLGFLPTLALVIGTAFAGYYFAKREGLRVWVEYQRALGAGQTPPDGVLEGLLILLGGVFLIVPGILTDVVGVTLLIPWSRRKIGVLLREKSHMMPQPTVFTVSIPRPHDGAPKGGRGAVIDTTGEDKAEEPPELGPFRG
jgi:UPF0716 protein FxsA